MLYTIKSRADFISNSRREIKMPATAENKKVSDMTAGELKELIRDTINELIDPDYGLELRPELEEELKKSIESKERIPVEKVAKDLGLTW